MTIHKNYFRLWLLLIIPAVIGGTYYLYRADKLMREEMIWTVLPNIGKTFKFEYLRDSAGNSAYPELTSKETIVDFWFATCPPCIAELNQFGKLLKGRGKDISIVSISVDGPDAWKNVFTSGNEHFKFIKEKLPNWQIVNLHLSDTARQEKNYVTSTYGIASFPGYLVLDQAGKVIATPQSAVEYITQKLKGRSPMSFYITEQLLTAPGLLKLFWILLIFNGAFWAIIFLILIITGNSKWKKIQVG